MLVEITTLTKAVNSSTNVHSARANNFIQSYNSLQIVSTNSMILQNIKQPDITDR